MTEPVAQGLSILVTLVLGAVIVATVVVGAGLARAVWADAADRRAARRRHPSRRLESLIEADRLTQAERDALRRIVEHEEWMQ